MKLSFIALLSLTTLLAACDQIDTMKEGFSHAQVVANQLQQSVGSKPFVGFNWNNGELTNVNITFQGIPPNATLGDIVAKSKQAVLAEFKQAPKQVIVSFAVAP